MKDSAIYEDFRCGKIAGLYHSFYRPLTSFAQQYLGDDYAFLAEDVVQEAFFQTFLRKEQIVNPSSLKSYLYHSVRNASLNILRKRNARGNYLKAAEESEADISHRIIEEETFRLLSEAIGELSPGHREVLEMSYFDGLKNAEVAQRLGISEIAVKKRKAKMLQALRQILSDKGMTLVAISMLLSSLSSRLPS